MTTYQFLLVRKNQYVVEAYRLDRYDNFFSYVLRGEAFVVEAYRLDRYDNRDYHTFYDIPSEL